MQHFRSSNGISAVLALGALAGVASVEEIQGQKGMRGGAVAMAKGINVTPVQLT